MREHVEPEVTHAIHARAGKKCECENPRCKHVAKYCRNGLNAKSAVSLPEGATGFTTIESGVGPRSLVRLVPIPKVVWIRPWK